MPKLDDVYFLLGQIAMENELKLKKTRLSKFERDKAILDNSKARAMIEVARDIDKTAEVD